MLAGKSAEAAGIGIPSADCLLTQPSALLQRDSVQLMGFVNAGGGIGAGQEEGRGCWHKNGSRGSLADTALSSAAEAIHLLTSLHTCRERSWSRPGRRQRLQASRTSSSTTCGKSSLATMSSPCSGEAPIGDAECTASLSVTAILCPEGTPHSGEACLATHCNPEGCDRPQRVAQTVLHCTAPLSELQPSAPERSPQRCSKNPQDLSSQVKGQCLGMPVARRCC